MDLKQKFTNAKKKIEENRIVTDALIIAGCVGTAAYAFYVNKRIDETRKSIAEAREDVEAAEVVIRDINENARHVRETGHSVTYFNAKNEPVFIMNAPTDD